MKPSEELKLLKGYIKLSHNDAIKRDMLEAFQETREKVVLLDADSLLFNVCNFHLDESNVYDFELMYDDYHTQVRTIVNAIEEENYNVEQVIHFFTTCRNNFRKEIYPEYKAHREVTPLVKLVSAFKGHVITSLRNDGEYVSTHDKYEADDLIAQAVEVMEENYPIVASIDKDLKQIPCCHFDYYKVKVGEDEFGEPVRAFRGFEYTTPHEGRRKLLKMLLTGDKSDNIKGVVGIGKVKAEKLLKDKSEFVMLLNVARAYNDMKRLRTNIKLMKL